MELSSNSNTALSLWTSPCFLGEEKYLTHFKIIKRANQLPK